VQRLTIIFASAARHGRLLSELVDRVDQKGKEKRDFRMLICRNVGFLELHCDEWPFCPRLV
jgi:hypothetical protein